MMTKISPRLTMLCVGLALLLSAGCKKGGPDKSVMGGATPATSPAAPSTATSQPAQTPATPAASGSTAPVAPSAAPAAMPSPAGPQGAPGNSATEQPMKVDKLPAIVARVNGQAVKKQELIQGAQIMQVELAQRGQRIVPTPAFYRKVLDQLVSFILIQQDAKAQGVTAPPQEVQQQLDARKHAFPNDAAYRTALAKADMTEATLRQETENQIVVQTFLETRLASQVNINDQTARQFYDQNKSSMSAPERVHLRHIVIAVDPKTSPADKEKAKQKAEEVYKKVQAGEDFGKLAAQYSDDPKSKSVGGDIGWIVKGQTVPNFEAAAFALTKPNDIAPVTETRSGYHVIQLLDRQAAGEIPFEQVKPRILAMLKSQAVQKLLQTRAEELRQKAKIETFI
ncbi:MAG TPA: peptidylprolyl isomerase [Thermoanaerobaculia bacterium]|nr:peptidylprolyl isomerase [Thermoanaerobaculia bacterium]